MSTVPGELPSDEELLRIRRGGATLQEIADQYGVTPVQVYSRPKAAGTRRSSPSPFPRRSAREAIELPALVRDDPTWTYLTPTGPVARRLRLWRTEPGRLVAVIAEHGPGMSVTYATSAIADQLAAEHPDDIVDVIEHVPADPARAEEELFDAVERTAGQWSWRRVSRADLQVRLGPTFLD